ncbi:unnamed protein product, partial [Menidia menidia]
RKKEEEPPTSPARTEVSTNPFDVDEDENEDLEESEGRVDLSPEWIQELPEDLDVCIAQRDFEGAVDLLDKLNEHLKDRPAGPRVKELRAKVEERVRQLTDVLRLAVSLSCSLGVSGQSTKACELFLKNRAAAVHTAIRQLRIEGATLLYIHKLCNIFFTSLQETAKEFKMDFAGNTGCYSAFVVWSRSAMSTFVAKEHCQQLTEIGLDLSFTLQSLLVKDIRTALLSYKDIIIEATKHRNSEEMWRRMNLMTPEALNKLKEDMRACGVSFQQYTGDDCWVNLSYTMVAFTKQALGFLEEGLRLYQPELHLVLLESLREIVLVAAQHVDYGLRCEQDPDKKAFILQNAGFLHDAVLPVVERRFQEASGKPAKQLQELRKSSRPPKVNPDSTTSLNASFLHDAVLPVVERRFQEASGKPAKQLQELRKSSRPPKVNPDSTTSLV